MMLCVLPLLYIYMAIVLSCCILIVLCIYIHMNMVYMYIYIYIFICICMYNLVMFCIVVHGYGFLIYYIMALLYCDITVALYDHMFCQYAYRECTLSCFFNRILASATLLV